jgi:hypothetical protein
MGPQTPLCPNARSIAKHLVACKFLRNLRIGLKYWVEFGYIPSEFPLLRFVLFIFCSGNNFIILSTDRSGSLL